MITFFVDVNQLCVMVEAAEEEVGYHESGQEWTA
jgi:hypothetical protein